MKQLFRKIIDFIKKIIIVFIVFSVFSVILFRWISVPITPLMLFRNSKYWVQGKKAPFAHQWISLTKMSANLPKAVIVSEDQKFLKHFGFDVEAIEKAYEKNKKSKHIKGASTISQQTAKNVFLWPERSYVRKVFEVYFTFLIETFWSKKRIIEVYLNSIEMGNGVFGAEAASEHWFRKPASKLTLYEAASIAAILPNPRKFKATNSSQYIEGRKKWILNQMNYFGPLKFE